MQQWKGRCWCRCDRSSQLCVRRWAGWESRRGCEDSCSTSHTLNFSLYILYILYFPFIYLLPKSAFNTIYYKVILLPQLLQLSCACWFLMLGLNLGLHACHTFWKNECYRSFQLKLPQRHQGLTTATLHRLDVYSQVQNFQKYWKAFSDTFLKSCSCLSVRIEVLLIRDEYVKTALGRSIFSCSQPWSMEVLRWLCGLQLGHQVELSIFPAYGSYSG